MNTNHGMPTVITYGSHYGSTEHYARKFAEHTGFPVFSYREVNGLSAYARVIHFGALYAGGVLGLRQIASLLTPNMEFVIVTVGLADVQDRENIQNVRNAIRRQLPEDVFRRAVLFHLRGVMDYGKLNHKHRVMMALLCARVRGLPDEKKTAEMQAMLETYGKQVSFVEDAAVLVLSDRMNL